MSASVTLKLADGHVLEVYAATSEFPVCLRIEDTDGVYVAADLTETEQSVLASALSLPAPREAGR